MSIAKSQSDLSTHGELLLVTWAALALGETGTAADNTAQYPDRSAQVSGVFGGATVIIEGSNDGATYFTLNDPFNTALTFTVAGLRQIMEVTRYIRARISGGDGTTAIVVNILSKRNSR